MSQDSKVFIIVWCLVCCVFVLAGALFLLVGVAEMANGRVGFREGIGFVVGTLLFVVFSIVMLFVGILGYRQGHSGAAAMSHTGLLSDGCLEGAIVTLFVTMFAVMGAVGVYSFAIKPIMQVVDARSWPSVACDIVSSKIRAGHGESAGYYIEVSYEYGADGERHQSSRYGFFEFNFNSRGCAQEIVDLLPPGTQTNCYVNPRNPKSAVIERGYSNDLWWGSIPLLMLVFGAVGIYGLLRASVGDS